MPETVQIHLLLFSCPFSIFQRPAKQKRALLRSNLPGITGLVRMDGEGYARMVRAFSASFCSTFEYPFL